METAGAVLPMTTSWGARALGEFVVDGIETTIPLFTSLIAEPDIVDGNYDIHWLENHLAKANSRG